MEIMDFLNAGFQFGFPAVMCILFFRYIQEQTQIFRDLIVDLNNSHHKDIEELTAMLAAINERLTALEVKIDWNTNGEENDNG